MIENHRKMGRPIFTLGLLQELPQHIAKSLDGTHGQAVALAGKWRQGMIGAENIA